tara:strand:- start:516 stop:719 length:204 start_codon:yes stop_codon:yes gene_type:complete
MLDLCDHIVREHTIKKRHQSVADIKEHIQPKKDYQIKIQYIQGRVQKNMAFMNGYRAHVPVLEKKVL